MAWQPSGRPGVRAAPACCGGSLRSSIAPTLNEEGRIHVVDMKAAARKVFDAYDLDGDGLDEGRKGHGLRLRL